MDDPLPTIHEPKAHKIVEPAKVVEPATTKKENRQEGAHEKVNNTNHNEQKNHRQFVQNNGKCFHHMGTKETLTDTKGEFIRSLEMEQLNSNETEEPLKNKQKAGP